MAYRTITSHHTNEASRQLLVYADAQDNSGASHAYIIETRDHTVRQDVEFQVGPVKEFGVNGVTHEALLAILIDRLEGFQAGPFACQENACALTALRMAKEWLEIRTRAREARGVEGTNVP